jgi:hypothetical protein
MLLNDERERERERERDRQTDRQRERDRESQPGCRYKNPEPELTTKINVRQKMYNLRLTFH